MTVTDSFSLWEQEGNVLPPRSRLYYLPPIGLGTGLVESLSSYSTRLAAAHNITHASLFGREIAPLIDGKYLRNGESKLDKNAILAASFGPLARAVNGTGITARNYAVALEKLTGRESLHHLTMLTWTQVIPHRHLLKPSKAWCPACYEGWRSGGMVVFEPLLWSLAVITVCPQHLLRLQLQCHLCNRVLPYLDSHSRPGFCSKCNSWLGETPTKECQIDEKMTVEEQEWHKWATEQVRNLLAAAPTIELSPKKEVLAESIEFCMRKIIGVSESAFARSLGVSQSTVNDWQRRGRTPELERLLKISFLKRIPLLDILMGNLSSQVFLKKGRSDPGKEGESKLHPRSYRQRRQIDINMARRALETALAEEVALSLQKVALHLHCSAVVLAKHFPELCKAVSQRYKKSYKDEWTKIGAALNEALVKDPPQSMRTIAKILRRHHTSIYNHFPDICRQITQRYDLYRRTCREQRKEAFRQEIRVVAIALHEEGLYPSVKRVEARLSKIKTLRYSKMALDTLRKTREGLGIAARLNNFARFEIS